MIEDQKATIAEARAVWRRVKREHVWIVGYEAASRVLDKAGIEGDHAELLTGGLFDELDLQFLAG